MDTVDPLRFLFAFIFVIGLIGVMAITMKRWGTTGKPFGKAWFTPQDQGGRVTLVEMCYIDPKRRLALVRRDDVEHLLLLADGRELVIESGIRTGMMAGDKG